MFRTLQQVAPVPQKSAAVLAHGSVDPGRREPGSSCRRRGRRPAGCRGTDRRCSAAAACRALHSLPPIVHGLPMPFSFASAGGQPSGQFDPDVEHAGVARAARLLDGDEQAGAAQRAVPPGQSRFAPSALDYRRSPRNRQSKVARHAQRERVWSRRTRARPDLLAAGQARGARSGRCGYAPAWICNAGRHPRRRACR